MIEAYVLFRNSAPYSYLLLALALIGFLPPIAIHVSPRVPRAAVWAAPALCALLAVVGYLLQAARVASYVDSPSIDRGQAARIDAEGTSESFAIFIVACGVSSLVLAVTSVLLAVRSWREVESARWGRGVVACGLGVLLSFAFLGLRTTLAGHFGYTVWSSDSTLTPALLPSLFGSVAALVAGAAMSGQPRAGRERTAAGDAIHAAFAASVAVALPLIGTQLKHWSTIFGATSGESLDAANRARIMLEGADEAHGLFIGNVVYMVPVVIAFAIALLPELRVVARGLAEGIPAYVAGLGLLVTFSAAPILIVPRAQARIEARRQMLWPPQFRSVTVDDSANDFDEPVLFVAKTDGPLEERAACDAIVQRARFPMPQHARVTPAPIAVEADRSAKSMHCLAESVREYLHLEEGKEAVSFVVNVNNEFLTRNGYVKATTQGSVRAGSAPAKPKYAPSKTVYFAAEPGLTAGQLLPLMAKAPSRGLPVLVP